MNREAKQESNGLGLFVRSLVGLDQKPAKSALGAFLAQGNLRANQIQFVDEVVNYLTEQGNMDAERLYEPPYTDMSPKGVDGVFSSEQVDELISILEEVRKRATG